MTSSPPVSNLEFARQLIFLVARLHLAGFGALRVMPTWDHGSWVLYAARRQDFLKIDGAFVARHRRADALCLLPRRERYSESILDLMQGPAEIAFAALYSHSQRSDRRYHDACDRTGSAQWWLLQCRMDDPAYTDWYLRLCGRMALDRRVLPARVDEVSPPPGRASFFLHFRDPDNLGDLAPVEEWHLPPAGDSEVERVVVPGVATPRPADSPNLLWPSAGKQSDSQLDEWYDQHGRP
jgi:hypothetical protein